MIYSSGTTSARASTEVVILFVLDSEFLACTWEIIDKALVHASHASSERFPFIGAFWGKFLKIVLSFAEDFDVLFIEAVIEWHAFIFDVIALLKFIQNWVAVIKIIFATDIIGAILKT